MKITDLNSYTFAKDIMVRNMGETVMVYNPSNGDMYELNDTAAIVIESLRRGMSGREILKSICCEYDVEEAEVIEDLNPLLDRLIELKLLVILS